MTNRQNAAQAVGGGVRAPVVKLRVASDTMCALYSAAGIRTYKGIGRLPDEAWLPLSRTHASMEAGRILAKINNGGIASRVAHKSEVVSIDTQPVPLNELTTDPYAAEGVRLAREDRMRRATAFANKQPDAYFAWRQSIGNDYYDEQDRLAGRVAANDNQPTSRRRAA